MKVLDPGHFYFLQNMEAPTDIGQELQFIKKETVDDGPILETVKMGTTNEEVLKVLIDRMQYLQSKFPCFENDIVIRKLEESLMWLNKRTSDRMKRGVEGMQIA